VVEDRIGMAHFPLFPFVAAEDNNFVARAIFQQSFSKGSAEATGSPCDKDRFSREKFIDGFLHVIAAAPVLDSTIHFTYIRFSDFLYLLLHNGCTLWQKIMTKAVLRL
jgi:hypothetical protein